MKELYDRDFIKNVENLIDPMEVSNLLFFSAFKKLLPKALFKSVLLKTSKENPHMGFIIDPYSFFLFFKLKNIEKAVSLLPARYKLTKARIFADEEPDFYMGMGIFNTRASTFWGSRLEVYLITEDTETGLLSWIFIDILSNTIIAVPKDGVADPNCTKPICTTNSKGEIILDFKENNKDRRLSLSGNLQNGKKRNLDQDLWVMGNTSIGHSLSLADKDEKPFAVVFDPAEVIYALDIPLNDLTISENTLFPDLAESAPCKALCFPFAQHYIADSPGCSTYVKNNDDMIEKYNRIAKITDIKTFSTLKIRKQFFIGMFIPTLISIVLFILLILK